MADSANMNASWDEKLPAGLRFMVTKTTKGRLGLIIGQHKFRKSAVQKDGSLIFRCSTKDCTARVNLDSAMRRVLRVRNSHNHPGRDLSDITSARLPAELAQADQSGQQGKRGRKSRGPKRQHLQDQTGDREVASPTDASLAMGMEGGPMDALDEAGPSGSMDNVRVKMEEPEWVDAGALEPNCELAGQYDDTPDYNAGYAQDHLTSVADGHSFHHLYTGEEMQPQQPSLVHDTQDPVKLRVPGKPNLTITVAPPRQSASHSSTSHPPPAPLHLLNPLLPCRKRGRPRGTAYGSYNESDDRVTTILTDSIIANHKLEKHLNSGGVSAYHPTFTTPIAAPPPSRVKPRSKDPEAVRAAEIVNSAQNRSGPRVIEELEKVHLKLRQEVLALEVQNLKAEREKLKAYRRNVAIRREIMILHLQLDRGIPSECASSGRGIDIVDAFEETVKSELNISSPKDVEMQTKTAPDAPVSRPQSNQSPKISIRKSLQTANHSPNVSPMSSGSSLNSATPPVENTSKPFMRKQTDKNRQGNNVSQRSESRHSSDNSQLTQAMNENVNDQSSRNMQATESRSLGEDELSEGGKSSSEHGDNMPQSGSVETRDSFQQSVRSIDSGRDDIVPIDSVSSDVSIEMLSEPGSSQMTQSSAPLTEQENFDDPLGGEDSYDISENMSAFSGGNTGKEPPDGQFESYHVDGSAHKRRRVENMWEPDDNSL